MEKVTLITGGAGFIGTNLVIRLLALGRRVIVLDNFFSSSVKKRNLFFANKNCRFINQDVRVPIELDEKVSEIYNLACPASPPIYQRDPIFTLETNIKGIINMLNLAQTHQAKLLQTSTSEVYGNPFEHPQKESYWGNVNPIGPRSCYEEGKRVAETFCYEYFKKGVDVRLIRIFNTYGPYMDPNDGRVVSNFVVQALKNQDITIYGDGSQTRSFGYVDDLISGMVKYMSLPGNFFGPINLGNPGEFSMLELAKMIFQLIPESKSKIIYKPLPVDDPVKRKPDISLAKKMLDWRPEIQLEEGLKLTIEYFKSIIHNANL